MIVILTCRTDGCMNSGIGIPFEDPGEICICGVCMNEITDKKAAGAAE